MPGGPTLPSSKRVPVFDPNQAVVGHNVASQNSEGVALPPSTSAGKCNPDLSLTDRRSVSIADISGDALNASVDNLGSVSFSSAFHREFVVRLTDEINAALCDFQLPFSPAVTQSAQPNDVHHASVTTQSTDAQIVAIDSVAQQQACHHPVEGGRCLDEQQERCSRTETQGNVAAVADNWRELDNLQANGVDELRLNDPATTTSFAPMQHHRVDPYSASPVFRIPDTPLIIVNENDASSASPDDKSRPVPAERKLLQEQRLTQHSRPNYHSLPSPKKLGAVPVPPQAKKRTLSLASTTRSIAADPLESSSLLPDAEGRKVEDNVPTKKRSGTVLKFLCFGQK